jgi:hypothetical protein
VFDPGTFEPTESSDDEPIDRHEKMNSETGGDGPECEIGGYLVRARRTDAWDAIVALLVSLEAEHTRYFHAVMQGARRLSNSRPEIDGLDDLLMAPEQQLHDVASERERRRSRSGYPTPADARAFLQMARQPQRTPIAINPIAAAYFREADEQGKSSDDDFPTSGEAVSELLADAGLMPERPLALLDAADEGPSTRLTRLRRLMESALHEDEAVYLARYRELAFLANTLVAGCSIQSRPFTPQEASDAAACICNLGLEGRPERWPAGTAQDLVTAFEVGWLVLYRDVSLFVTDQLTSALADADCADADIRRGLRALRRTLVKQREAGTPWRARDAADVLAMLDTTAWISVLGLLDECPVLPAALMAVLERRTTPVSPTAFEFISTTAQIGDIRVFMGALPGLLTA